MEFCKGNDTFYSLVNITIPALQSVATTEVKEVTSFPLTVAYKKKLTVEKQKDRQSCGLWCCKRFVGITEYLHCFFLLLYKV